jgi:hypothetical protein
MTAVIAAPRTATVAASTVTAAASQRSRRLGAIAACGGAAGIAGRIATGIVDTPWPGARRRLCPESKVQALEIKPATNTAAAKSRGHKVVSDRSRILAASDEHRVN